MKTGVTPPKARLLRSQQVVAAALLIALVLGALAAGFVAYKRRELQESQLARAELYARTLEDQTASAMSGTDTILRSLVLALEQRQWPGKPTDVTALLQDNLRGRPFLRSLSWLDGKGQVVASSDPGNVGLTVPLTLLGGPSGPDRRVWLAPLASGRDLGSLGRTPLAEARVLALPMVASFKTPQGPALLVALLNPDHFATQFQRTLSDTSLRGLLLGLDGRLIVATSGVDIAPGTPMSGLPAFSRHLPAREFTRDVGVGSDDQLALSALRTTREWPLVVLVEQPRAVLPDELLVTIKWTLVFLLSGWALLGAGTRILQRVERALRDSEARAQATFEQAAVGVLQQDFDGRLLRVNQTLCTLLGYSRDELLALRVENIVHPEDFNAAAEGVRHLIAGASENFAGDRRYRRRDGSWVWARLTLSLARDADGQGLYLIGIVEDVSARREAEMALRQSQALLDKTERIGGIGGWTLELGEAVARWTDQTAVIHDRPPGYQPRSLEEAISYYAPGAADLMAQAVQRALTSGEAFDLELPLITARGRRIWVRAVGLAEYEHGRPVRMVGAFQDITEGRRVQDELAQARERELTIGSRIQQALLVDTPDQRLPGLWLSTLSQASQRIDGDFVELISLRDHGVDIIVGDVMGKGVAAALMAAATKMQFSRCVAELVSSPVKAGALPTPADVVAAVHRVMTHNLQDLEAFVTLSYVRLDTRASTVTWVGCGSEEPILLNADGKMWRLANQHPPMGVLSETRFEQHTLPFRPGDALFMCSDGAADALLPDGSRLGRERVMAVLSGLLSQLSTPAAVLHALRGELTRMGVRFTDDLTLALAISAGDTVQASRRELVAGLDDLPHVRGLVEARSRQAGLDEVPASLFAVACVEAYTNAVRHTIGRPAGTPVELVVRVEPDRLVVDIVTLGEAFTPELPERESNFAEFPEGGFGLNIMTQATDGVEHHHALGVNMVRLTRQLPLA